jgi:hypothetical protein
MRADEREHSRKVAQRFSKRYQRFHHTIEGA